MGQQQLLLLVLGIVIVGLAVVVGIQAFTENMKKSNSDALVNDAIRIASDAQAWKLKPVAFGGGADTGKENFSDFSLEGVGYEVGTGDNCSATQYENLNGCFSVTPSTTSLIITATSLPGSDNDNQAQVTVVGTAPSNITTDITTVDDAGTTSG